MSEDIAEKYDLIIVGSNNPIGYLKTPTIYSSKGEEIIIRGISTSTKARFSGNDLTLKSVEKLTTYAETGKPMLLSQDLYYSTKNIDSSANIYKLGIVKLRAELVKVGVSDRNIMHEPSDGASYRYMLRMVKPVITISDKFKMKYSANVATTTILSNEISNLKFDGTIGTTAKTYNLVVTVDKNSNGLFAAESSDETNEVCYKGNVTTAADGKFDIILNLPESARGYMAWKAVATDISTNLSSQDLGGFVIEVKAEDIKTVKLLQILPNGTPITLNMKTNTQFQNLFSQVETVSGIKLDVTTMTTRNYEDMYKNGNTYTSGNYDTNNMLKNYSMVVLGFSDAYCYDDISNANGALDNLYDYIGKNNSVLFVHDTMSFASYSDGSSTTDKGKAISGSTTWGFQLTNKFRYLIGMDRYGASLNKGLGDSIQGYTNDFLLRFARTSSGNAYSIFTNIATYTSNNLTEVVNRLNQGQVTEFPYATGETLSISPTHAQYFQLDLEGHSDINKDIVVWYTLGANTSKYAASKLYDYTGQDALNNYYIYSKGNITYSGAGHSDVTSVSELKLFVNTVIKAILSGNSVPQIEVHNAATVSSGKYDLFTRDNTMLPMIEFTPSDTDLSKYTGVFESGLVYWDVDGSGTYNTGDVNLKVYDSNSKLKNEQMVTLDLQLYKDIKNASGDTMRKCFDNNELKIGIQATDACQSMGYANVSVKYRNLFNLN